MLATGLYLEHALALLFGLVGFVAGAAALVMALRGSKGSAKMAVFAVACSAVVIECGVYSDTGSLLAFGGLERVLHSDFGLVSMPALGLGIAGLFASIVRAGKP